MLHSKGALHNQFRQNSALLRRRVASTNDTSSFIMLGKTSHYHPASISPTSLENFLLRTVRGTGSLPVSLSARQRHTKVYKAIQSRASQLCAQGHGSGCAGVLCMCYACAAGGQSPGAATSLAALTDKFPRCSLTEPEIRCFTC